MSRAAPDADSDALRAALTSRLGPAVVLDPTALCAVRTDRSGWIADGEPLALVEARSVTDIQEALRFASEHRLPVVPRGAGSGLAGAAVGTAGSLVVSTARMDRILEIVPEDELAVVEPGVINQRLNDALRPLGLVFSPDPASKAISSIGGNIATNAGGLLCAKYGVTREAVLGLLVVLPDGSLLRTGHRSVKGVTGYNLTALLVGSEGTLAIVAEATVRLRPEAAGETRTVVGFFPSVERAAAASAAVTADRLRPAVMELMDQAALRAVDGLLGTSHALRGDSLLVVQTDGEGAESEATRIAAILAEAGGDVQTSADAEEGERLLVVRRSIHIAMERLGHVLIEDVAVPRSRLAEMFRRVDAIAAAHGATIVTVAHAGDGNLHPIFSIPPDPSGELVVPDNVWEAAGELFGAAIELGGTLTGEHGVGVLKRRWLAAELGDASVDLQRRIKAAFDPLGIMNPGKVFEA